jgi:hypothetical protein
LTKEFVKKNANKTVRRYRYANDLCAMRLGKCSIEGGLVRNPKFQNKLLDHVVDYQRKDPKASFGDTDTVDGFSFNVLFGKYRLERQVDNDTGSYYGERYVVTHTGTFRVRFDLLYTSARERHLSLKWMHEFADELARLEQSGHVSHLNFSYHTSQTLTSEIEKFSKFDVPFVVWFFVLFWSTLTICMWLNWGSSGYSRSKRDSDETLNGNGCKPTMHNRYSASDDSLPTQPLTASSSRCCGGIGRMLTRFSCHNVRLGLLGCCASCCSSLASVCARLKSKCFKPKSVCINGASFLPVCLIVQFVLTIVATYGLISLLNIETNPMTFTVVFIILGKSFSFHF